MFNVKTYDFIRHKVISLLVWNHQFKIVLIRNDGKSRLSCLIDNLHTGMRFHLAFMPLKIVSYDYTTIHS